MTDKVYEPTIIEDQPIEGTSESIDTTQSTSNDNYSNVEILPQPLPKRIEVITSSLNTKTRKILEEFQFTQSGAIQIGKYESSVTGDLRLSPNGITARNDSGVTTFAIDGTTGDATFLGTIQAGSIIAGTISGDNIIGGTITGVDFTIGTANNVFKADSSGIYLGNATYGSAPFRVSMAGALYASSVEVSGKITTGSGSAISGTYVDNLSASKITAGTLDSGVINTGSLNANNITTGTLNASTINVTNLNADNLNRGGISGNTISLTNLNASNITTGTLSVGGTSQPSYIYLKRGGGYNQDSYLRWEGGSKMWSDSSNRIGINSIGSPMYIYVSNNEKIIIPSSGQVTMRGGVYADGNLNVTSDCKISRQLKLSYDNIDFSVDHSTVSFAVRNMGLTSYKSGAGRAGLSWGNGANFEVDSSGSWFHINGYDKSAIMGTSEGYNALYCAEAPEVWFFDFCDTKDSVDPMFLEVTEGKIKWIKTEDGYQVWRRRRGHSNKRFESKTAEQYYKNEDFLRQAKV